MQHIAVECPHTAMVALRKQCWTDCHAVVNCKEAKGGPKEYLTAMLRTMQAGATRDTHAIMLGRPLEHHIQRWDSQCKQQKTTNSGTFQKLVCKVLAITITAISNLWRCRGMERARNITENKEAVQSILFPNVSRSTRGTDPDPEEDGYSVSTDTSDNNRAHNRAVAPGGWGAAISHMAVSVEWAPDPPRHRGTMSIPFTQNRHHHRNPILPSRNK
jgi:hypothetical protein